MRKMSMVFAVVLMILPACKGAPPAKPTTVGVAGPAGEVNFLAMGDWGTGGDKQKSVAEALAVYAAGQGNIQAMILAGDNFYMKLASVDDPVWKSVFEDMYDTKRLAIPFYDVLGNHDYQENKAQIELDYSKLHPESRWKLPARWYRINIPADKPLVSFFMLDSTKDKFSAPEWAGKLAGHPALPYGGGKSCRFAKGIPRTGSKQLVRRCERAWPDRFESPRRVSHSKVRRNLAQARAALRALTAHQARETLTPLPSAWAIDLPRAELFRWRRLGPAVRQHPRRLFRPPVAWTHQQAVITSAGSWDCVI